MSVTFCHLRLRCVDTLYLFLVFFSTKQRKYETAKVQNNESAKLRKCETAKQRKYETTKVRNNKSAKQQQKCETKKVRKNERAVRNNETAKQRDYETTKERCETTKLRNNKTAKGRDGPIRTHNNYVPLIMPIYTGLYSCHIWKSID